MPRLAILLLGAAACSDYEFSDPKADPGEPWTRDSGPDTDEWEPGDDTAPDTGPDTGTDDACYEPEDGYAQNAAARLYTTDGDSPVSVTLVDSDTAYSDELWLDAPQSVLLAQAWVDPPGTTHALGPYRVDTELVFGARVRDTGDHWQSGPSSRNADGVVHVAVTYEGGCSWLIGFEDLYGGGDLDFNDVVLRVQGRLRQED